MNKILVTGGAGFIGSNLVDALVEQGHEVSVVDDLSSGDKTNLNPRAKFFELSLNDKKLSKVFVNQKPDAVFHLAAQIDVRKSVADPVWDAECNIIGSLKLLELCREHKTKKIIFSSTGGAIYGDTNQCPTPESHLELPISPYGIAKLTIEKYLNFYHLIHGLNYVALRYANVYGPRQNTKGEAGVVAIFCDRLLQGKNPTVNGDGSQTRDYVYVADVVAANLLALNSDKLGIYNVGTGVETSVNDLASRLKQAADVDIELNYGPAKAGEQQRSCLDYSLIKTELGWQPTVQLAAGLEKTVEWFACIRRN